MIEPPKGGSERRLASDLPVIATVEELIAAVEKHGAGTLHDWSTAPTRYEGVPCPRCGPPVASRTSDPSTMLAVVLLAMANTIVLAAVFAAAVWLVT